VEKMKTVFAPSIFQEKHARPKLSCVIMIVFMEFAILKAKLAFAILVSEVPLVIKSQLRT